MLINILDLIRIKDWLKNIIIFFPLIFSGQLSSFNENSNVLFIFIIFCLSASIIYIINDILDSDSDKLHPIKSITKPIASNRISKQLAFKILILVVLLLIILLLFNKDILFHVLAYFIINLSYNFFLKNLAVIDIITLSLGYVVRLDAGSNTIQVTSSGLMLITIFSLSFYVLSIKRLKEFLLQSSSRISLKNYSKSMLKILTFFSGLNFLFFYLLYIIYKNNILLISFPLIIFILIRYYKIAIQSNNGEFPIDLVIKDKILFALSIITIFFIIFVYI
tara:strand:+ start:380 stop:1213 length:834 start_codon:yes stop_codon:yes gene_type:complete